MNRLLQTANAMRSGAALIGRQFLWMFPAKSLMSGEPIMQGGILTPEEFTTIEHLAPPWCKICAFPFEKDEGEGAICAGCAAARPKFDRLRAPLIYSDAVASLILPLKYSAERSGLRYFGKRMSDAGHDVLAEADMLIPVPLHYRRLLKRGYNQAGWLATAVSKDASVPVRHDVLLRKKASPSQGNLSARQRRQNVAGAFAIRKGKERYAEGKRIVLIDDVFTTGATVEACAMSLKRAKAASVDVLTLARVVAPKKLII